MNLLTEIILDCLQKIVTYFTISVLSLTTEPLQL